MIFNIKITLSDNDSLDCRIIAADKNSAIEKLKQNENFKEFTANREIVEISAVSAALTSDIKPGDYICKRSKTKENYFNVTEISTGTIIQFEKWNFDETKSVMFYEDSESSVVQSGEIITRVFEWLAMYHYGLLVNISDNHRNIIGKKLHSLRMEKGLSLRELANACDLPKNTISRIEQGTWNLSVEMLNKIVNALDAEIEITKKAN